MTPLRKFVVFAGKLQKLVDDGINKLGPEMEKSLTRLMELSVKDHDMSGGYYCGQALRNLLLGRLNAAKFLTTSQAADSKRAHSEMTAVDSQLAMVDVGAENGEKAALLRSFSQNLKQYLQALNQLEKIMTQRNQLVSGTLDKIGPEIADQVENVKLSIKAEQDELRSSSAESQRFGFAGDCRGWSLRPSSGQYSGFFHQSQYPDATGG